MKSLFFYRVFLMSDAGDGGAATAEAPKATKKKAKPKHQVSSVPGGQAGKATKKKAVKKAATKESAAAKAPGEYGAERKSDLPWCDKKVAVFKAAKALKALGSDNAKAANDIAEKAGLTNRDVRHYMYHAEAAGLAGHAEVEGVRGYAFFLTKKGAEIDPVKAFKDQEAAKK